MSKSATILVFLTVLICSSSVVAAPTVGDHLQRQGSAEYQASILIWFDGAISAFLASNADLKIGRKQLPLFCLPAKGTLSGADALAIVNQEISSRRWQNHVPLSSVLLDALQRLYPCK